MSAGSAWPALGQASCTEHPLIGLLHVSRMSQSLAVWLVENKVIDGVGHQ